MWACHPCPFCQIALYSVNFTLLIPACNSFHTAVCSCTVLSASYICGPFSTATQITEQIIGACDLSRRHVASKTTHNTEMSPQIKGTYLHLADSRGSLLCLRFNCQKVRFLSKHLTFQVGCQNTAQCVFLSLRFSSQGMAAEFISLNLRLRRIRERCLLLNTSR
jgi:hypothetical protein